MGLITRLFVLSDEPGQEEEEDEELSIVDDDFVAKVETSRIEAPIEVLTSFMVLAHFLS